MGREGGLKSKEQPKVAMRLYSLDTVQLLRVIPVEQEVFLLTGLTCQKNKG